MTRFLKRIVERSLQKIAGGMGLPQISNDIRELRKICNAIQYQTAVAPDGLPIPPPELHFLVSGNADLDVSTFFEIGRACAVCVTGLLRKHDVDVDSLQAILDFGCGCGRVTRHFHSLKQARIYGTDYNPKLVAWCKNNLPFAEFEINGLRPPLAYESGKFDLIYAFSVFTHLPQSLQVPWLTELSRVLKPGGYLLFTTHGEAFAEAYLPPHEQEQFRLGHLVVQNETSAGENICGAYHPFKYVKETLATEFAVLDFLPGQHADPSRRLISQDTYLLKKSH